MTTRQYSNVDWNFLSVEIRSAAYTPLVSIICLAQHISFNFAAHNVDSHMQQTSVDDCTQQLKIHIHIPLTG